MSVTYNITNYMIPVQRRQVYVVIFSVKCKRKLSNKSLQGDSNVHFGDGSYLFFSINMSPSN